MTLKALADMIMSLLLAVVIAWGLAIVQDLVAIPEFAFVAAICFSAIYLGADLG